MTKKTATQLDMEIARALVEAKQRPTNPAAKVDVLRVSLSRPLATAIRQNSGLIVFYALQLTPRGYRFESADPAAIRAFWLALFDVYRSPPKGRHAIGQAAGKKLADLRPVIQASWPAVLALGDQRL